MLKFDRQTASQVIALVSGHSTIKKHLKEASLLESSNTFCRLCQNEIETIEHIISNCNGTKEVRLLSFGSTQPLAYRNWKVINLVQFSKNKVIEEVIKE